MAFREDGQIPIPVSATTCLMLGPGTKITHAAINTAAGNGCLIIWCGGGVQRFYALGTGETRSAANLLHQARLCMNKKAHMEVVRRMYMRRFGEIGNPRVRRGEPRLLGSGDSVTSVIPVCAGVNRWRNEKRYMSLSNPRVRGGEPELIGKTDVPLA